jgi:hypothetical protein
MLKESIACDSQIDPTYTHRSRQQLLLITCWALRQCLIRQSLNQIRLSHLDKEWTRRPWRRLLIPQILQMVTL